MNQPRANPRTGRRRRARQLALVVVSLAIGCSSQSGKPGGAGGMGGAVTTGCTDPLMIDDMEDGDGFICASGSAGRHGEWFTTSDGTSANLSPSPTGPFAQTLIPGGRGTSRYAARMTGSGFQVGAAMGFHLNGQGTTAQPYDASTTQGIKFWMKSNVPVLVTFPLPETVTAGRAGGTCVDDATAVNCGNHFLFPIAKPPANEWVEYDVPYSAGSQYGLAYDPNGNLIAGSATWNPSRLLEIVFSVGGSQSFDVWIDDVRFYSCAPAECVPTCTDPNAPVACPAGMGYAAKCWSGGTDCSSAVALNFSDVWGSGPNDVWAVGAPDTIPFTRATIVHWDGSSWSVVSNGSPLPLLGVWGSGPDDVWAVGSQGIILHWDGTAWSETPSGTSQSLTSVWGSGPNDVWAAGLQGTILHWDGTAWSPARSGTALDLWSTWGSGPHDVWAVGNQGTVVRWDGSVWSRVPSATRLSLVDVWGSDPSDVWAVGGDEGDIIIHWNGSAWSLVSSARSPALYGVWGSGPNDVWAVGVADPVGGAIVHWDGTSWSAAVQSRSQKLLNVWGSEPNNVWAVGHAGSIVHWDGAAWSTIPTGNLR